MTERNELAGRVAVVTGAGRNIGRAIARELAAAGAAVLVNARANRGEAQAVVGEIERQGGRALAHLADVADAEAVETMMSAAVERFGRIDILVNNAALRREQPLEQMSFADWREILGVILDGAFLCVKAALPQLRASGAGVVVNIGGLSAHTGARHRAHVVAAKAGLVGFTRALAHELAAERVTVNCVAPGLIATARAPGAGEPAHHGVRHTLTGSRGTPDDIAATVRFLCGPQARYITGQTFHVNGGAFLG
jgi:3-oxoacyl-[acyl-carrier protein] reductase